MLVAVSPQRVAQHIGNEAQRQFNFLLRAFTPRTVFMQIGPADAALALLAASYVERVWLVAGPGNVARAPCNLRLLRSGGVAAMRSESVDVAFSEAPKDAEEVCRVLVRGGVYFAHGQLLPAQIFREAGFSRVQYFAGNVRVPAALARISHNTTTAAYK
jgi:hypothetical protein